MARSSSSSASGSRFASSNLNDLYGKPANAPLSGANGSISRSRYGGAGGGGMLVLSRPGRTATGGFPGNAGGGIHHHGHRSKVTTSKLTVPGPVNLPSLRKEHAGNDPSVSLVGNSGTSGWSKQVDDHHHAAAGVTDGSTARSNGWAPATAVPTYNPPVGEPLEQQRGGATTAGKYTPPGARGSSTVHIRQTPHSTVLLRGEDFPTLQAAAPFNPVPSQQRKQGQQQQPRDVKPPPPPRNDDKPAAPPTGVALQPQGKHSKEDMFSGPESGRPFSSKENRKPNDMLLRPGPVVHLSHTSAWADDERETVSSATRTPEWDDGPRRGAPLYRDDRPGGNTVNVRRDARGDPRDARVDPRDARVDPRDARGDARDYWDRDNHFGRNDSTRDWNAGRNYDNAGRNYDNAGRDFRGAGWGHHHRDRGESGGYVPAREHGYGNNNRGRDSYLRDDFFNRNGPGGDRRFGGRNGGFDWLRTPGHNGPTFSEDAFLRDFPELANLDIRGNRFRRRKEETSSRLVDRDPERDLFETEIERVQKEQELERQRKHEERERAIEAARREQEERERVAREAEEERRRVEAEAREAAARAEREAVEAARKAEDTRRSRDEERQRMMEEEEQRKENARKKLLELEERMEKRKQLNGEPSSQVRDEPRPSTHAVRDELRPSTHVVRDEQRPIVRDEERPGPRFTPRVAVSSPARSRVEPPRLRSPDVPRRADRFSSWRRDADHDSHYPQMIKPPMDAESFYGNTDGNAGERREDRWMPNGGAYSPRFFDREERWNNRRPPSPGAGYDGDGPSYGRLRQSLPKQPRVPPPPMRAPIQRQSSLKFSEHEDAEERVQAEQTTTPAARVEEEEKAASEHSGAESHTESDSVAMSEEQSDKHIVKEEDFDSGVASGGEATEEEAAVEKHVVVAAAEDQPKFDDVDSSKPEPKDVEDESETVAEASELHPELSDFVDSIPDTKVQVEETPTEAPAAAQPEKESEEEPVPVQPPAPVFNQQPPAFVPPQIPMLDSGPRMQTHLPFGLLPPPGSIQIGSLNLPLQLPIGHHVTHMQHPPQFQFGQQTMFVHPMQHHGHPMGQHQFHLPPPHPERTLWGHQFGQVSHGGQPVGDGPTEKSPDNSATKSEPVNTWTTIGYANGPSTPDRNVVKHEDHHQEHHSRKKQNRSTGGGQYSVAQRSESETAGKDHTETSNSHQARHDTRHEDGDFIEVRSKRQMLNERREEKEKEKQGRSRGKFAKDARAGKEHQQQQQHPGAKQRHVGKSQAKPKGGEGTSSMPDFNLDVVVSTVRTNPVSLSNPEVGYEKRTKSPQTLQNMISDGPSFPSFVADSQRTQGAWGFRPSNQEMEAVVRFDSKISEKVAGSTGPVNSLLAGEKIQFGAVTMPAILSPVAWPHKEEDGDLAPLKRSDDGSNIGDSEAEAEAAASAIAVAAISNDDYVHNATDHLGVIGSASSKAGSPGAGEALVRSDDSMSVSLPADLSVIDTTPAMRGQPHPGQHLPSAGFSGMEMLGGPVYAFNQANENQREQSVAANVEAGRPPNWPHHSGAESFYAGPPSYTGPFLNHGPTLVYTNPYAVGQFGVSYMGPMPPAKQPDWKHTPVSTNTGASSPDHLYGNRHIGHDPSVISVMPQFEMFRDVAYQMSNVDLAMQSQWSHIPIHNPHIPGYGMQLRHPPPPFHLHHMENVGDSNLTTPTAMSVPVESTDQFPDELGLGDSMSSSSDASAKPVSPLTGVRPSSAGASRLGVVTPVASSAFQSQGSYAATTARRSEKRAVTPQAQQGLPSKVNLTTASTAAPWLSQGRKGSSTSGATTQSQGRLGGTTEKSRGSSSPGKLKQVYVAKPSSSSASTMVLTSNETGSTSSEVFTAEARHA